MCYAVLRIVLLVAVPCVCAAAEGGGGSGHPAWSYGSQQGQLRGVAPELAGGLAGWRAVLVHLATATPWIRGLEAGQSLAACTGTHIARWGWASQHVGGPLVGPQSHCDRA